MNGDRRDAVYQPGFAHLAGAAFYNEVRVKSHDNMLVSTLITAQTQLLKMQIQQSNQIRGMMKTFGLIASWGLAGCSINMSASWRRPIRNGSRSSCRFSPYGEICVARLPG